MNYISCLLLIFVCCFTNHTEAKINILNALASPIIFKGNDTTAYRDPAVLYHNNVFYLFFTLVKTENGKIYSYVAESHSVDLKNWSSKKILTVKNQSLDFSSPGDIIRYKNEWILCIQSYPRPDYTSDQVVRYGTNNARIYTMRSKDLKNWSNPEMIKVKGFDVDSAKMGRMIDPYLFEDNDEKGMWWCFYKQNGVSMSFTYDFRSWTFYGYTKSGENVCVLNENNEYILFNSPANGISIKRSSDLKCWRDWGNLITLGQKEWDWAKGRITAGVVINLKNYKEFGKYVMFFHGSGPKTENEGDFDKNASIGFAWSDDLLNWDWPGKNK